MFVSKFASAWNHFTAANEDKKQKRAVAIRSAVEPLESRQLLSATLTLVNPDVYPAPNRLIFNTIQNPDTTVPNVVHKQQSLQISDTGTSPLIISSLSLSGPWSFVGAPSGGYSNITVNPGTPLTVTLLFTQSSLPAHSYNETNYTTNANGGAEINGSLTINSNDSASPSTVVTLAGYWQDLSNNNEEPNLQTITNLLAGYQTNINSTPIPDLTESNNTARLYGSEVAATSWEAANPGQPVSLQQLAAYRTQGNNATVYWFTASTQVSHKLYTAPGNEGQSLLPTLSGGGLAAASFTPNGAFGLRVDNEYSTDSINVAAGNDGGGGHHFRFFPLVSSSGATVPNTYIVAMDYGVIQSENFDFNDNVFVVSNIRPSGTPATPAGLTATNASAVPFAAHPTLSWTADSYSPVAYNVYSSSTLNGTYTLLTSTPISSTTFTDTSNTGAAVYYRVTAVDTTQSPVATSVPATTSANVGPVTSPDSITTYEGAAVTFNPLTNDSDASGTLNPASIQLTSPNHGATVTVNTADGLVTYTPAASFTGTETFTYTVADSNGDRSAATTVTATVSAPVAVPPVVNNLVVVDQANTPIQINELSVDYAATTFNPSSVTFTVQPTNGRVALNSDGSVTYTPGTNFVGGDSFTYTVRDNNGVTSGSAIVNINVGTEISSARGAARLVTYNDENGNQVTVSLNRGVADVYFDGTGTVEPAVKGKITVAGTNLRAREVVLSGTTAASVLKLSSPRGGQFNLGGVTDTSPLGAISAPGANLRATGDSSLLALGTLGGSLGSAPSGLEASATVVATTSAAAGTINLAGVRSISLRTIDAGDIILGSSGVTSTSLSVTGSITDTPLSSTVALGTVKALSWLKSTLDIQPIDAPSIARLQITGEFDPDLTLDSTGRAPALGTAHVGGTVKIGNWSVTGNAHSIFIGAVDPSWGGINVSGNLAGMVIATGNLTTDITAGSINSLKIAGILSGDVTTTGNLLSLQAGQLLDSLIDVGSTATSIEDATTSNLGGGTLRSLHLTSKAAGTFSDSSVVADVIDSIVIGAVNAASSSTEGVAAHVIKGASLSVDGSNVHLPAKDLLSETALQTFLSSKDLTLGTFAIDLL